MQSILSGRLAPIPIAPAERNLLREAMVFARGLKARDGRAGVLALAESMVTSKHADCVRAFAEANGIKLSSIGAIGFHGQTVLHRPEQQLTVQLGDGVALSAATGVPVVYDFRAADVESGGQGAPLVPIYHRALALRAGLPLPAAFVNIGGISNVTFVPEGPAEGLIAFDAGPGNCLIDDWAHEVHRRTDGPRRQACDGWHGGPADAGEPHLPPLFQGAFAEIARPRHLHLGYDRRFEPRGWGGDAHGLHRGGDRDRRRHLLPERPRVWIVSGGGARNPHMFEGLRRVLGANTVTADEAGFSADFMEAQAFAYLAVRLRGGFPPPSPARRACPSRSWPDISLEPSCATAPQKPPSPHLDVAGTCSAADRRGQMRLLLHPAMPRRCAGQPVLQLVQIEVVTGVV